MDKASLRSRLRASRNCLTARQQSEASQNLLKQFIASGLELPAHTAVYLANDAEIDPENIYRHLWSQGKKTYLPKISGNSLTFVNFDANTPLVKNTYGIPEPQQHSFIVAEALDLILIPLVGFDETGNRIGMGGGFYDRKLQTVTKPKLIGLAHELQKVDAIASDDWDIPLDGVLTDKNFYPSYK